LIDLHQIEGISILIEIVKSTFYEGVNIPVSIWGVRATSGEGTGTT
jgi:hypothetical protein